MENTLKALHLRRVFLWPRFRMEVASALSSPRDQERTVEVSQSLLTLSVSEACKKSQSRFHGIHRESTELGFGVLNFHCYMFQHAWVLNQSRHSSWAMYGRSSACIRSKFKIHSFIRFGLVLYSGGGDRGAADGEHASDPGADRGPDGRVPGRAQEVVVGHARNGRQRAYRRERPLTVLRLPSPAPTRRKEQPNDQPRCTTAANEQPQLTVKSALSSLVPFLCAASIRGVVVFAFSRIDTD